MARIAVAWELGGGLGHVGILAPILTRLAERGHSVSLISRHLNSALKVLGSAPIQHLQAPIMVRRSESSGSALAFGDLLLNVGYRDPHELRGLFLGWKNLLQLLRPDAVLLDHAPTATLAALRLDLPCSSIGTGFCQPPPPFPLPPFVWWKSYDSAAFAQRESQVVEHLCRVLPEVESILAAPGQVGLGQLTQRMRANFLTTFRELDHYPTRNAATYYGSWSPSRDLAPFPGWPSGNGRRIFAYLKPMPCLNDLILWLDRSGHQVVIVGDGIDFSPWRGQVSSRVMLLDRAIDLAAVKENCDLAILNGNHGVSCEFLLAGVPLLQLPLSQEQLIMTHLTVTMGAALGAAPSQVPQVISQLNAALDNRSLSEQAVRFAKRNRQYDARESQERIADEIHTACHS